MTDYDEIRKILADVFDTGSKQVSENQRAITINAKALEIAKLLERTDVFMEYGDFYIKHEHSERERRLVENYRQLHEGYLVWMKLYEDLMSDYIKSGAYQKK